MAPPGKGQSSLNCNRANVTCSAVVDNHERRSDFDILQATSARLPPAISSISAIDKTTRQSLWRALSTPSVQALNLQVQQDMDLERIVAGQDW